MADFIENVQIIGPDNYNTAVPYNSLNDINILYSYTDEEFELKGVPVIEHMIYNVTYTVIGSRWFEPEYGSRVPIIIHEPCTLETANKLEVELFYCIKRWVPIIELVIRDTVVIPVPDENLFLAYYSYIDYVTGLKRDFTIDLPRVVQ